MNRFPGNAIASRGSSRRQPLTNGEGPRKWQKPRVVPTGDALYKQAATCKMSENKCWQDQDSSQIMTRKLQGKTLRRDDFLCIQFRVNH